MAGTGRAVALIAVLVLAAVAPGAVANPFVQQPDTDSTVTRIAVHENATATWEVQVRTRLPTDEAVDDYERFQERFRENTSEFLDPFAERMTGVVAETANATGRPMRATDFTATTTIQAVPRRWGIVTYRFDWTAFAASDGDALVVGDAFRGQFYLTANDSLAVTGPDSYALAEARPDPAESEQRRARWVGERTFADDRPYVRFEPTATPTQAATAGTGGGGSDDSDGSEGPSTASGSETAQAGGSGGSALPLVALALVPMAILAFGAYRFYDGDRSSGPAASASAGSAEASSDTGAADAVPAGKATTEGSATGDPGGDDHGSDRPDPTADAEADADGDGDADPGSESEPEPIITDEDRVSRLLEDSGGQLRQSEIVDELGWSKSKTSRVLSGMEEDDEIEKLRIGRENVIRLPEAFDDEDDS